ncbi:hypothetical protein HWC44_gp044 [Mycobacterium phage ThetaBob]|uniref:DUF732 domain-containing protein n=1 Tax=Mycobacterium phage ThetaBob TaxID=2588513 RepID=A0A4Y6EQG2_9CAUD|nr:hypothetical protein HWC44_gp044 [Mycobacterium phage ThetaBob]QDF19931.1 hypothetical protein SEA_THETABOB_44 [Mycobacterium phage ThetaBob]
MNALDEPPYGSYHSSMGESEDPTELAGVADADTMSAYAWSLENEVLEEPAGSDRPFWITAAAVGVSLACVAVAGVLGVRFVRGEFDAAPAAVVTTTAPTTAVKPVARPPLPTTVVAPPPVTVTTVVVQTPAAPPSSAPQTGTFDRQLLAKLTQQGWVLPNPAATIDDAHAICLMLRQGKSRAETEVIYADAAGRSVVEVSPFIGTIIDTYPNCP